MRPSRPARMARAEPRDDRSRSRRVEPQRKLGRWRSFRGVLRPCGGVLAGLGLAQGVAALAGAGFDLAADDAIVWREVTALLAGGLLAVVAGGASFLYGRGAPAATLTRREALLAVSLIWIAAGVFGGLPFVIAGVLDPAAAFFETTSGLTTTGATTITAIERDLSRPLLLWRSLLQWLGGMGIVVLFVAVFPTLGAGAKHMFKGEVPGTTAEGLKPRIAETSFTLWKLYALLTVIEAALLVACGMDAFEALCHAFTTMSTGGFSTRDASVAAFESAAIEYVIAVFMLLGSLNFALYYRMLRERSPRAFVSSTELKVFVVLVGAALVVGTLAILPRHGELEVAFRQSFFQVATFVSSTGYISDDYMRYPPAFLVVLLTLMFIGGCSGSTAGGAKVERVVLMAKVVWAEIHRAFRPAQVRTVRMGRAAVPPDILTSVAAFVCLYVALLALGVLAICVIDGVPVDTAFGATLTCIANSGPAAFYQGGDHFADYSGTAKVVFSFVMLLGRLELFTMFALLAPDFWRR